MPTTCKMQIEVSEVTANKSGWSVTTTDGFRFKISKSLLESGATVSPGDKLSVGIPPSELKSLQEKEVDAQSAELTATGTVRASPPATTADRSKG